MQTPEWDIFSRIEHLEEQARGELTINDAFIIALFGLRMAYMAFNMIVKASDINRLSEGLLESMQSYNLNSKLFHIIKAELDSMNTIINEARKYT